MRVYHCYACKTYAPQTAFYKDRTRNVGVSSKCKECADKRRNFRLPVSDKPRAKLYPCAVIAIRRQYLSKPNMTLEEIAQEWGVARTTINDVVNRRTWRQVE